jgi:hypothetical protein
VGLKSSLAKEPETKAEKCSPRKEKKPGTKAEYVKVAQIS